MRRWLRRTAIALAVMAVAWLSIPRPDLTSRYGTSRAFFDRDGRLLRLTLASDDRYRLPVDLEQIAPIMREATLLYEDRDFFSHPGVDPLALLRAAWSTYVVGTRPVGASTVTMQVARLHWGLQTRSIGGKLIQIVRALQLGRHYSKEEIFAAYLNLACYGRNIEGVEAASLIYFNKHAAQLTLPEALALSVIPQNPNKRNPTDRAGLTEVVAARARLFAAWLEQHPDDKDKQVFFDLPLAVRPPEQLPFTAPHLVTDLDRQLPSRQHGAIVTPLDRDAQISLEGRITSYVERRQRDGIHNAAAAVLNYRTMEIEALVGSADFNDAAIAGQVNGTTARRSPGSTLKPFVYALAMDQQLIHPLTLLKDAPRRYGGFTPENYDQQFLGPVFARDALIASRNVPAVSLQAQLKAPSLYSFLQQCGVDGLKEEAYYGLALTLGGAELTMLDLLHLYAILPNGGLLRPLHTLRETSPTTSEKPVQVLSPEACFLILDILTDNPPPTRPALNGQVSQDIQVAWKTGTSYAFRDAWAVGISGDYVVAVWVGNFSGEGNPTFIGRTAAGPLLFDILRDLNHGNLEAPAERLKPGLLNLARVRVCAVSGDLPGHDCPQTVATWYIPGVSPIKVCSIHRAVPIDAASGLRACWQHPGKTNLKVFEFWPSDLQQIFRRAGIALRIPPPFDPDCSLDELSSAGHPPQILSPMHEVAYRLRNTTDQPETIPFQASCDADVRQLYWFVDDGYVGESKPGKPLFWPARSGSFAVRAVDDHGRAAQIDIEVGRVAETN